MEGDRREGAVQF